MTETKKYTGSCHCGSVRFEVTTGLENVMSCNCSICSRSGYLLSFVPVEQFTLLAGEDQLTDYQSKASGSITCSARRAASDPSAAARVARANPLPS